MSILHRRETPDILTIIRPHHININHRPHGKKIKKGHLKGLDYILIQVALSYSGQTMLCVVDRNTLEQFGKCRGFMYASAWYGCQMARKG